MFSKRTTRPDGVNDAQALYGATGALPPKPLLERLVEVPAKARKAAVTPTELVHTAGELWRHRHRIRHRPTMAQLVHMARFGGSEPCSYELDPVINWLPESLPIDFPFGSTGLCFAKREPGWFEERVVLPNGIGFSLA